MPRKRYSAIYELTFRGGRAKVHGLRVIPLGFHLALKSASRDADQRAEAESGHVVAVLESDEAHIVASVMSSLRKLPII